MATDTSLERLAFDVSRAAEYFDLAELQAQTSQPRERFFTVVLKEAADNGSDSAEKIGTAPHIYIGLRRRRRSLRLYVRDNGPGIPVDVVKRILDFSIRTSDKAAYHEPTRGAMGNAAKTIIGIPYALGGKSPVLLEGHGVRHVIRVSGNPAGEVEIDHGTTDVPNRVGTRLQVTLPDDGLDVDLRGWARRFAMFNPHATIQISEIDKRSKQANSASKMRRLYKPLVAFPGGKWRKFLPRMGTPPDWYDAKSLAALAFQEARTGKKLGRDMTLRDFVRKFRGLRRMDVVKRVLRQFPGVELAELDEAQAEKLLNAMKTEAKQTTARILGLVGKEQVRQRFDQWFGVKRYWYATDSVMVEGIPFVVEAAVAQTKRRGKLFCGANFSPTYDDPLSSTCLHAKGLVGKGVENFLSNTDCNPGRRKDSPQQTAVMFHIITPRFNVLDRAKTRLDVPYEVAKMVARALAKVTKTIHREEKRRQKDAARQERAEKSRESTSSCDMPLTQAVPQVMMEAVRHATEDGRYPISAHSLYYVVRQKVQQYTSRDLESSYFEQDLLPDYQQKHRTITLKGKPVIYYESRGTLYEPHTGIEVPLGTREVEDYQFPFWLYDKILFVEKQGLWPVLKAARIAERYDMAIVAGEGYATEACRILMGNADRARKYQLFGFHDADPYGYNIARTLQEQTDRMPGHYATVIDLGLKLQDALDMGLAVETFTRRKALPQALELTELEREYFEGTKVGSKSWKCRRVELNAFTSPALIGNVETELQKHGVRGKVIPPARELSVLVKQMHMEATARKVNEIVAGLMNTTQWSTDIGHQLKPQFHLGEARRWINDEFAKDLSTSWRRAVELRLAEFLDSRDTELEVKLRGLILRAMQA